MTPVINLLSAWDRWFAEHRRQCDAARVEVVREILLAESGVSQFIAFECPGCRQAMTQGVSDADLPRVLAFARGLEQLALASRRR
jgi:hypothetical protein